MKDQFESGYFSSEGIPFAPIEDLDNELSGYELNEDIDDNSFDENLAIDSLEQAVLNKISNYLVEQIEMDIEASKPWFDSIKRAKEVLGFNVEDVKHQPFPRSCRTIDSTMANSLMRFYATTRGELLPQTGPAGFRVIGQQTPMSEDRGERVRDFFNYYLTTVDRSYYPDFERFLMYFGFNGDGYKKIYKDDILGRPVSRFIMPEDFIIDANCSSVRDSNRLTHILHLSKREILIKQEKGLYRDVKLSVLRSSYDDGEDNAEDNFFNKEEFDVNAYEEPSLYSIYECHVYLNLDDFTENDSDDSDNIPLPYIVTLEPKSKEILSIRRNWRESDPNKLRKNYFVQYNYLPSFGVRGYGMAHILGSSALTLTSILRQLIDAGQFKNLPGGIRQKGALKGQNNDILVGPGQFVEVDSVDDLTRAFMLFPFSEPSQVLRELRLEIRDAAQELGSTAEMAMLDSKEDIPTGTMMAALETRNKIQSAVLKSIHYSLTEELQLLYELFKETIDEGFIEEFDGNLITYEDFADDIKIIPISDPSVNSAVQKIMRASLIVQTAMQAPQDHNMREVFKYNYEANGIDIEQIDKILKPDPAAMQEETLPLDPGSENINLMMGKPVKAAQWQNHPAHILTHSVFAEQNKDKPELVAQTMAHITEHQAMDYLNYIQELLGMQLPSLEELQNPEIQNAIAMALAQKLEETGATQATGGEAVPIDPQAVMLADIQQREAETEARVEIAKMNVESKTFSDQLDFEATKAKIESAESIAKLKSETELIKQGVTNA